MYVSVFCPVPLRIHICGPFICGPPAAIYYNAMICCEYSDLGPDVNGNHISNIQMAGIGQSGFLLEHNGENTVSGGFVAGWGGNTTVITCHACIYNYFMSVLAEPGKGSQYQNALQLTDSSPFACTMYNGRCRTRSIPVLLLCSMPYAVCT